MNGPLHRLLTDVAGDQSAANESDLPGQQLFESLWLHEKHIEMGKMEERQKKKQELSMPSFLAEQRRIRSDWERRIDLYLE